MVIDAIMVCFCEDCRANDGSEERPYYMSNSLKVINFFLLIGGVIYIRLKK